MTAQRQTRGSRGPILWPLVIMIIGVLLLLSNFLLLGSFNITGLLPLVLVGIGVWLLLRGDVVPSDDYRTFAITRGSVEEATLEISSGEIDVAIRAMQEDMPERLIAGQFAPGARPSLNFSGNHAFLKMRRYQTPWIAFADWELGLARQLPWQLAISASVGQVVVDASDLILNGALIATGTGDIFMSLPYESLDAIAIRSTFGNIQLTTPPGVNARIYVEPGRFFKVNADLARYEEIEPNVYLSRDADAEAALVEVSIRSTFGDAYLA